MNQHYGGRNAIHGGGGGGESPKISYTGRLRPIGVPFFRRQVHQSVGVSLVEAYERVEESVVSVCKRTSKG